jgi:hypothetical protein
VIFEFGARSDADEGRDARPIDFSRDTDASLLDAAMGFIEIDDSVEAYRIGARKRALDLGAQAWLIGLDGEEIVRAGGADRVGDGRIRRDGVDRDDRTPSASSRAPRR